MVPQMTNHQIAHRLATAGIAVFPASAESKHPLVRFTKAATTLPRGVSYFWKRFPDAVPAIYVGACGLVVLDLDRGHGDETDGIAEFEKLVDQHAELPTCPAVRTPRDGVHLYFRQPTGRDPVRLSASQIGPGIDVRSLHGYVIAPGAIMATGEFYESIAGTPDLAEAFASDAIPELPTWLAELAAKPVAVPVRGPSCATPVDSRRRPYGLAILHGEAAELAATPRSYRNGQLNKAAFVIASKAGAFDLVSEGEAWNALWAACTANGYIADDGPKAFERTFWSGWHDGLADPTPPPERLTVDPAFASRVRLAVRA
jgi:hypothetical protein